MKFDDVLGDGRLWAVRYDGMKDNILFCTFHDWVDIDWLEQFFTEHIADLRRYFRITEVNDAIIDTITDATRLQALILDLSPEADLDLLFRPLDNNRTAEMLLGKEKAKGERTSGHPSWLRLYALKVEPQIYIITGGAIKLTYKMEDRQHTLKELERLEVVRNFLIEKGVADLDGMIDLKKEEYDKSN